MKNEKRSGAYSSYTLALLSMVTALNYYDRNLIGILVEDLKIDLQMSDTQIGLLSGLAFALVYSFAAIPIARYADGGRRVRVLALSASFWSIMTAACGSAHGFSSMLLARIGVGVGEAGGLPTTHAIVADSINPKWRATGLAVIGAAGAVGMVGAFALGGAIAEAYGWRWAFYAGAIPGVILSIVVWTTLREPSPSTLVGKPTELPLFREALQAFSERRSFVLTLTGLAIVGIPAFGALAWGPAYLMRNFQLTSSVVGQSYGAAIAIPTLLSILVGGLVCDWLTRRDERWPLWLLALSFGLSIPLSLALYTIDDFSTALIMAAPLAFVGSFWTSACYALIQSLSGARFRTTGAALLMFVTNLIGQGFGPLLVGWFSDLLTPTFGHNALRVVLVGSLTLTAVGVLMFLLAARTVRRDIAEANQEPLQ